MPGLAEKLIRLTFTVNNRINKCHHSYDGISKVSVIIHSLTVTSATQLGICQMCLLPVIWDESNSNWYTCEVTETWKDSE